ncbi:tRNA 2-thiouridine(34) synthase MnmA, partial [Microgenomates group bacterium]|nr:tRNA 2-thiouridine(34) synthase MnmA [Microgenomates group bacterium]
NQEIKFGMFLKWAIGNKPASTRGESTRGGFDYMATGHYARQQLCSLGGQAKLLMSADRQKDQTYFLAMLKQEQLRRVLFPIGHLTKKQVRLEAKKRGLAVWNKKDSSGICFIGHDLNFREFLKRKIKEHEGEAVDKKGQVIGKHQGFEFYTIGQRYAKPLFVIEKDIKNNRLIVGSKKDLEKKEFAVEGWSWINSLQVRNLQVRIRHQGRLIPCKIVGKKVFLKQAGYGNAPGQVAVIYHGLECLGGGTII